MFGLCESINPFGLCKKSFVYFPLIMIKKCPDLQSKIRFCGLDMNLNVDCPAKTHVIMAYSLGWHSWEMMKLSRDGTLWEISRALSKCSPSGGSSSRIPWSFSRKGLLQKPELVPICFLCSSWRWDNSLMSTAVSPIIRHSPCSP